MGKRAQPAPPKPQPAPQPAPQAKPAQPAPISPSIQPAPQPAPTSTLTGKEAQQPKPQQPAPPTSIQPAHKPQGAAEAPSPQQAPKPAQPQPSSPASQQPSAQQLQQIKETAEKLKGYGYTVMIDACPRCGRRGTQKIYVRGARKYVYVYHRLPGGKEQACYIGPADGYVYVHRVHGNLALTHLRETNYADVIVHAAKKYVQQLQRALEQQQREQDEQRAKRISMKVYDIIYALRDLVELARESCESFTGKYRDDCLMELKDALSCS